MAESTEQQDNLKTIYRFYKEFDKVRYTVTHVVLDPDRLMRCKIFDYLRALHINTLGLAQGPVKK